MPEITAATGVCIDWGALYNAARSVLNPTRLNAYVDFGGVGAALVTEAGGVYTGVCVDTASSMGMCAEVAAVAAMLTAGETEVVAVVAVDWDGATMPPCGKCREFFSQLGGDPLVALPGGRIVRLSSLLPEDWKPPTGAVGS